MVRVQNLLIRSCMFYHLRQFSKYIPPMEPPRMALTTLCSKSRRLLWRTSAASLLSASSAFGSWNRSKVNCVLDLTSNKWSNCYGNRLFGKDIPKTNTAIHTQSSWWWALASSLRAGCSSKCCPQNRCSDGTLSFHISPLAARVGSLGQPVQFNEKHCEMGNLQLNDICHIRYHLRWVI